MPPKNVPRILVFTGTTGKPHRPSSTDGHPSLLPLSLAVHRQNPIGLAVQDARRSRSPYRVPTGRTVRH
jgi:hypothetical protein